jgi:hypothetical protein
MKSRTMWVMALLPVLVLSWCAASWAAERAGVVIGLQGAAVAAQADGQVRALSMSSPVFAGETLRTEAGARIQIMFEDDSLVSLGENSELTIDEYVYDPNKPADNGLAVRIGKGLARVITGAITDLNPERFKVRTSRATIGIRGCELGFRCLNGGDHRYFVVRVPAGRAIGVMSKLSGEDLLLREAGYVDVDEAGRLRRGFLREEDLRELMEGTTPQFAAGAGRNGTAASGSGGLQHEAESPAVGAGAPATEQASEDDGLQTADTLNAFDGTPDPSQSAQESRTGGAVGENRVEQIVPPPPPPPEPVSPPFSLPIRGGGAAARYLTLATMADLDKTILFYKTEGVIANGRTSVDFWGDCYDRNGVFAGSVTLSLRDIGLIGFGGRAVYEGWREITPVGGVRLANDNLQQFVRHIDLRGTAPQILYWGVPSDTFADSPMPPERVLAYDIAYCEYRKSIPLPRDLNAEVRQGVLRYNTKTGDYALLVPGSYPIYGHGDTLQFFGQYQQGVGAASVRQAATPDLTRPAGSVLAGFRNTADERAAESGVSSWRGYAAAMAWTEDGTPASRELRSAVFNSDFPGFNEDRVQIHIDRNNAAQPVVPNLVVSEAPPSPSPSDLTIANVQDSVFVEGRLYSAKSRDNNTDSTLAGVVGDTLSPAAFQTLANGAQSYLLQTPADRPGHVTATITAPAEYHSFLEGQAYLTVNIPGSGATPTWMGRFAGTAPNGDQLNIRYNTPRGISPNGHLQATAPDIYSVRVRGTVYGPADLSAGEITGNLVGPGTGPRPITGAIGAGRYAHADGSTVNLTYGTDLAP